MFCLHPILITDNSVDFAAFRVEAALSLQIEANGKILKHAKLLG